MRTLNNKIRNWLAVGLIATLLSYYTQAQPLRQSDDQENLYEGDLLLSDTQRQSLKSPIQGRAGLLNETKRWPDRTVFYKIEGKFDAAHRDAIQNAINILEERTCVKFVQAPEGQSRYVRITADEGGCYSAVGYLAKKQQMNLQNHAVGEGCFRMGSILHEFMHVLGFYHEQSAADRDHYVKVLYENITPGKEFNFEKYDPSVVTDFGVGYDYESVLHFSRKAFSVNGEDTIVPLDPTAYIGQRVGLSRKDIDKINTMYKCPIPI